MLFNSFAFAIFLPIVFILYWAIPHKYRWLLLMVASYYFYMSWNPKYVVLILFTTAISYGCAILLERTTSNRRKKTYIAITIVSCLGILFFFKYFNFFSESVCTFLSYFTIDLHPVTLSLILPVGISFYTFQTFSYVLDVYKGEIPAEHHFGHYATFISFFPQLVAGPIERASNLLPQINSRKIFDYSKATYGLKLMAWGYFKKIVVADTLARYVDLVYANLDEYNGFALILAILFFTFQIYCDFSGYSDIAVGSAKLLGIDLMTNFKSPYFATSIKEFWSRWHISLSTWFRDYVYIPLGGNRCSKFRQKLNLLITFLLSGLWHGANWSFVIWGACHGVVQILEKSIFAKLKSMGRWLNKLLALVCVFLFCNVTWVFFRAENLSDAIYIFLNMFDGISNPIEYIWSGFDKLDISRYKLVYLVTILGVLNIFDYFNKEDDVIDRISKYKPILRWGIYVLITMLVIFFSEKGVAAEFIYFQF